MGDRMLGFREIIGHEMIKEHFKKAIETDKVSHAYILSGEVGMGRKSLANAFTLSLLCDHSKSDTKGEPCMMCHACKQILSGNHPDLIYVTHEKPGSIGVDDVRRQIQDTISIRPYSSLYKIYIVDDAEKMTVQAQNALLKTIEEPPSYAVIFLLTRNLDSFLSTILSRCVQLKLKPLCDHVVKNYLIESMGVQEEKAEIYAAFSRGNLGKAIHLSSSDEFQNMYRELLHLLKYVREMDMSELLDYIRKIKEEYDNVEECLDFIQMWYRDVLMYKVTKDVNLLIFKEESRDISLIGNKNNYENFEIILKEINKARIRIESNVNIDLAVELMLLAMKEKG